MMQILQPLHFGNQHKSTLRPQGWKAQQICSVLNDISLEIGYRLSKPTPQVWVEGYHLNRYPDKIFQCRLLPNTPIETDRQLEIEVYQQDKTSQTFEEKIVFQFGYSPNQGPYLKSYQTEGAAGGPATLLERLFYIPSRETHPSE